MSDKKKGLLFWTHFICCFSTCPSVCLSSQALWLLSNSQPVSLLFVSVSLLRLLLSGFSIVLLFGFWSYPIFLFFFFLCVSVFVFVCECVPLYTHTPIQFLIFSLPSSYIYIQRDIDPELPPYMLNSLLFYSLAHWNISDIIPLTEPDFFLTAKFLLTNFLRVWRWTVLSTLMTVRIIFA